MKKLIFVGVLTIIVTGMFVDYAFNRKLRFVLTNTLKNADFSYAKNTKYYICPSFIGGLGNQMFQFASSYGIARYKGMKVVISLNCQLLKIFNIQNVTTAITQSAYCKPPIRTIKERVNAAFDKNVMTFNVSGNVRLINYLQSFRYFDEYIAELRKLFQFKVHISKTANEILKERLAEIGIICQWKSFTDKYRSNKPRTVCFNDLNERITLIGSHVRRGDWLKPPHPQNGFQTASREYLERAVQWYKQRYHRAVFVVASNGMQWTKQNFPKNNSVLYLSMKNPASTDLAILSLCEHFMATVGTFSWWAGWLTGGNVTYFKWPAKSNSKLRKHFGTNFSDYFYPQWVGI